MMVFCAALAGAIVGGAVSVAIGGMGVIRVTNRRLTTLEDECEAIDRRITSEVKTRAARASIASRNVNENLTEALALAAKQNNQPQTLIGR